MKINEGMITERIYLKPDSLFNLVRPLSYYVINYLLLYIVMSVKYTNVSLKMTVTINHEYNEYRE